MNLISLLIQKEEERLATAERFIKQEAAILEQRILPDKLEEAIIEVAVTYFNSLLIPFLMSFLILFFHLKKKKKKKNVCNETFS